MTRARRFEVAAAAFAALVVAALAWNQVSDPDLGFHLATGRAVLLLGRIPATNVLTFTEPNHRWPLHEWAPAVLFTLADRWAGARGILALKEIVVVATWLVVFFTARRRGASASATLFVVVLAAAAASMRFVERPQIFSDLALALVGLFLARAQAAEGKARTRSIAWAGGVVAIAWQLHAGAIVASVRLAGEAIGAAFEPSRAKIFHDEERDLAGRSDALALAVAAAGSLALAALLLAIINPSGAKILLVPFQLGGDASLREHVAEYKSPFAFPFEMVHLFWAFAFVAALFLLANARRLGATKLVAIATFTFLALRFVRVADAFAIVLAPSVAIAIPNAFPSVKPARLATLLAAIAIPLAVFVTLDHDASFPPGPGFNPAVWPTGLLAFADEHSVQGPAFVSDAFAGPYLADRWPKERVFFDARFEAYSPALVETYRSVRYGEQGWDATLDRYGVEVVLMKYTSPGEREKEHGAPNLRQKLVKDERFALVAFDDIGELFVRKDGSNAELARSFAITGVEPDRGDLLVKASTYASLRAADARGLSSARLLSFLAVLTAGLGDKPGARALLDRADATYPGDARLHEARESVEATPVLPKR